MKYHGFRGWALEFIKLYLNNRFQYTKTGDSKSKLLPIVCSVLQNSLLGTLLFVLYINDLLALNFFATLYVDDTYLALSDKSLAQLEMKINAQLQYIKA